MKYTPRPVPTDFPQSARAWLQDELRSIQAAIAEVSGIDLDARAAAPSKLNGGVIAYADGTNWNPGNGAGIYAYLSADWVKLSVDLDGAETVSGDWVFSGSDVNPGALKSALSANMLHVDGKEAIDGNDTYLRLNQNGDFSNGIYTPGALQAAANVSASAGSALRAYNSANTVITSIENETVAETATSRSAFIHSAAQRLCIQSATIADDATATFDINTYTIAWVLSTHNSTTYANLGLAGTLSPTDFGSGANVSIGSSNPDVDGNVNIWPSANGVLSIKNRQGVTRTFSVMSFQNAG